MTAIYFVRHGHINRLGNHPDPVLTARGIAEAEATARQLAGLHAGIVFSSNLRRAAETAAILAKPHGLPIIQDPRLRERANFGDLPGQSLEAFLAMWERGNGERTWQSPVGDSSQGCGRRVEAYVAGCYARWPDATIIAASHGGTIADFLLNVFSLEEIAAVNPALSERPYSGDIMRECSITVVEFDGKNYVLRQAANSAHLPPQSA